MTIPTYTERLNPGGVLRARIPVTFEIPKALALTHLKPLTLTLTPPKKFNPNTNPA